MNVPTFYLTFIIIATLSLVIYIYINIYIFHVGSMMSRDVRIFENEENVLKNLAVTLEEIANEAISHSGVFTIGLSGGSMPRQLSTKVFPEISTSWSKWKVFFCDERIVPFSSQESTYGAYLKEFQNNKNVTLTSNNFIAIDPNLTPEAAALNYVLKMADFFPLGELPRFDALLLGLGPDGHTCSLFPRHALLEETAKWVAHITDSPKPPPNRITMTLPVLNAARNCIFVVIGDGKADVVKKILKDNFPLPASLVRPLHGTLSWFLDVSAASKMNEDST